MNPKGDLIMGWLTFLFGQLWLAGGLIPSSCPGEITDSVLPNPTSTSSSKLEAWEWGSSWSVRRKAFESGDRSSSFASGMLLLTYDLSFPLLSGRQSPHPCKMDGGLQTSLNLF